MEYYRQSSADTLHALDSTPDGLTQAQADELLAEYDGKPYFDADRPEAGVIGTGYAMEQADFEKILEALDIPWEAEANPQRTTELYCIVVTADED